MVFEACKFCKFCRCWAFVKFNPLIKCPEQLPVLADPFVKTKSWKNWQSAIRGIYVPQKNQLLGNCFMYHFVWADQMEKQGYESNVSLKKQDTNKLLPGKMFPLYPTGCCMKVSYKDKTV